MKYGWLLQLPIFATDQWTKLKVVSQYSFYILLSLGFTQLVLSSLLIKCDDSIIYCGLFTQWNTYLKIHEPHRYKC